MPPAHLTHNRGLYPHKMCENVCVHSTYLFSPAAKKKRAGDDPSLTEAGGGLGALSAASYRSYLTAKFEKRGLLLFSVFNQVGARQGGCISCTGDGGVCVGSIEPIVAFRAAPLPTFTHHRLCAGYHRFCAPRPRCPDVFSQVDKIRSRSGEQGMGLSLARKIVQQELAGGVMGSGR